MTKQPLALLDDPMLQRQRAGKILSEILKRPLDGNDCVVGGDGAQKIEGRFHLDFLKGDSPPKGDWLVLVEQPPDAPADIVGVIATNELRDAWKRIGWGHFRVLPAQLKPVEFLQYLAQPCARCGCWPTSTIRGDQYLCGKCFEERERDRSQEGAPSEGVPPSTRSADG